MRWLLPLVLVSACRCRPQVVDLLEITDVVQDGNRITVGYRLDPVADTAEVTASWRGADGVEHVLKAARGAVGTQPGSEDLEVVWDALADVPLDAIDDVTLVLAAGETRSETDAFVLGPSVRPGDVAAAKGGGRPVLAGSDALLAVAWQQPGDEAGVSVAVRPDGDTWRAVELAEEGWNPTVAVVQDAAVVAWQDYRDGSADLYAARWALGEVAPEEAVRLDADAAGACNSVMPALSGGPEGQVAAVWTDNREDDLGLLYQTWSSVYVSTSSDGGRTWAESDRRVDTGAFSEGTSVAPQAVWDDSGALLVAWQDDRLGPWLAWVNRSEDAGTSWWEEDLAPLDGALDGLVIAAGHGRVALAWEDHSGLLPHVRVAVSEDGGQTFLPAVTLDAGDGPAVSPAVAVGPDGLVAVAWQDASAGLPDVHVAISGDGGATFTTAVLDGDGPGASAALAPRIAITSGGAVAVGWLDARTGTLDPRLQLTLDHERWLPVDLALEPEEEVGLTDSASLSLIAIGARHVVAAWREGATDDQGARIEVADITW